MTGTCTRNNARLISFDYLKKVVEVQDIENALQMSADAEERYGMRGEA
jgi:hypothetical protein